MKTGYFCLRPSNTCFLITYSKGLYVWNFFARAVSIAAAGSSLTDLTYDSSRSQVRLISLGRFLLVMGCVHVVFTRSSSSTAEVKVQTRPGLSRTNSARISSFGFSSYWR